MPLRSLQVAVLAAVVSAACGSGSRPSLPTQPTGTISPIATDYLNQLIGLMQNNSINRLSVDWTAFRAAVFADAGAAQTITDLFPAIRTALRLLGDGHSSYRSATGTVIFVATRSCRASGAGPPSLPATIGYVKVTSFSGSDAPAVAFADGIQATIMAADRDDLIGWVVDLRGNGGGNMWPMVAGVGPIIGDGPLGYFISPTGVETLWEYRDGASWSGGGLAQRVTAPYRLRRPQPRVAVLSDNGIASSGEATLIAFRQRPNTRSFGDPTCGLSTANRVHPLSDNGTLTLTNAVMADRAKVRYGDTIPPDEVIPDQSEAVRRAVEWLTTGR